VKINHRVIQCLILLAVASATYAGPLSAKAQTAVYSTLIFTNRETSEANQNQYFADSGVEAGFYHEGYRIGRFSNGFDVRGSFSANDKFLLGGFRTEILSRKELLRPYFEFLLGPGSTRNIQDVPKGHLFYEYVGGIDCPMGHIDFRVLELGIGKTLLNNSVGTDYTGGNLWETTASSGVVYRF